MFGFLKKMANTSMFISNHCFSFSHVVADYEKVWSFATKDKISHSAFIITLTKQPDIIYVSFKISPPNMYDTNILQILVKFLKVKI